MNKFGDKFRDKFGDKFDDKFGDNFGDNLSGNLQAVVSNQITVVAFQSVLLAQASFLQKNQMLQNVFLISVTLSWHRASVACKNQSF